MALVCAAAAAVDEQYTEGSAAAAVEHQPSGVFLTCFIIVIKIDIRVSGDL